MKSWARLAMLLALISAIGGVYWIGHSNGKASQEEAQRAAIEELMEAQRVEADALYDKQRKIEQNLKRQVRTIYVEQDTTGCADAPALSGVLDGLRTNAD